MKSIQRPWSAPSARTVLRWATGAALAAFSLLVVGALAVLIVLPRATHGSALTVLTGSMSPGIPVGSVVLDRPVDTRKLEVGDVVTYQPKPGVAEFITHRIVKVDSSTTPTTFIFKGDANRGPDLDPVPATAIRGAVWFHVPYLGAIRDALHGPGGISLLAMLLLGGYACAQLASGVREHRDKGRAAPVSARLGRPLILVSLRRTELVRVNGLADGFASGRHMILLAQDTSTCRLLIAPPEPELDEWAAFLRSLDPISMLITTEPTTLVGTSDVDLSAAASAVAAPARPVLAERRRLVRWRAHA